MKSDSPLVSLKDFVAHRALQSSILINSVIFFSLLFIALYFLLHSQLIETEKLFNSYRSSVAQSIALGDAYQITRQINSFVTGEIAQGIWVYDSKTEQIIASSAIIENFYPDYDSQSSFILHYRSLFLIAKYPIYYKDPQEIVGTIFIIKKIPIDIILWTFSGIVVLLSGTTFIQWYLLRRIGNQVVDPLISFRNYLKNFLVEGGKFKKEYEFAEISEIAFRFSELISKIKEVETKEKNLARKEAITHAIQMLAHDIGSPLSVIEKALLSSENEKASRSLRKIRTMIEGFKRVDEQLIIKKEWIDGILLKEHIEELKEYARAKSISLEIYFNPNIELLQYHLDFEKFERAIINISRNSLEAASNLVELKFALLDQKDLQIMVCDNGPGIPADVLPRIFEIGFSSNKPNGTGLGLAYVKNVIYGHDGTIDYSRENGRTVFTVHLYDVAAPKIQTTNNNANEDKKTLQNSKSDEENYRPLISVMTNNQEFIRKLQKAAQTNQELELFVGEFDPLKHSILVTDEENLILKTIGKVVQMEIDMEKSVDQLALELKLSVLAAKNRYKRGQIQVSSR